MHRGWLRVGSLVDQVGVIAERGLPGSDEHFATMARCATVSQLRTALKMQAQTHGTGAR